MKIMEARKKTAEGKKSFSEAKKKNAVEKKKMAEERINIAERGKKTAEGKKSFSGARKNDAEWKMKAAEGGKSFSEGKMNNAGVIKKIAVWIYSIHCVKYVTTIFLIENVGLMGDSSRSFCCGWDDAFVLWEIPHCVRKDGLCFGRFLTAFGRTGYALGIPHYVRKDGIAAKREGLLFLFCIFVRREIFYLIF